MPDVQPDPETWRWLQQEAAEYYEGSITAAAADILRSARLAETDPAPDPWASLQARQKNRVWAHRVPVGLLLDFCDRWDAVPGATAEQVLADLRNNLAR